MLRRGNLGTLALLGLLLVDGTLGAQDSNPERPESPLVEKPQVEPKPAAPVKVFGEGVTPSGKRVIEPRMGEVQNSPTAELFLQPPAPTPAMNVILSNGQQYRFEPPIGLFGANPAIAGHSALGAVLTPADETLRLAMDLPRDRGLVVSNITPGGPADRIKLEANDIVLAIDGVALPTPESMDLVLPNLAHAHDSDNDPKKADKSHKLEVIRGGKPHYLPVQILSVYSLDAVPEAAKPDLFIGVMTAPADDTLRSHLAIPPGTGLIVQDLVADAPASKAGIQKGDILLSLDSKPLSGSDELRALIQKDGENPFPIKYLRKGKTEVIWITPAHRPAPVAKAAQATVGEVDKVLQNYIRQVQLLPAQPQPYNLEVVPSWNTAYPASPDTIKKLDDLSAQIKALTQTVEALRKPQTSTGNDKR